MFESLSNRLQDVFKTLRGETRLTPENVEAALREIRLALLEADVNFKVVKAFVDRVRDRALGQDVLRSLSPAQQVVKIVRDEMVALFGDTEGGLKPSSKRPRVILLLGLQGAGKTTTAGKLAKWLTKQGKHTLLVSTDVKRPAAIQQLNVVAQKAGLGVRVHDPAGQMDPVARAKGAVAEATNLGYDVVIVDSAGRLHIDDELMTELEAIRDTTGAADLLYVADAMTGQDAIKSAGEFNRRLGDHRRDPEQARRRCARRRGALGRRRRRRADCVRRQRRAAGRSRAVLSRSRRVAAARAWATCSR